MNIKAIISTLSFEERQQFVLYLEKKNKRSDAKNIQLFKLLCSKELSSKDICLKLYKTDKCNAYHALRKRLFQSLIDFIANMNLEEENTVEMQIIKYILASRTFLLHNKPKTAYKVLDKAEALAKEQYLYNILNEIYHTKIQYAYTNPSIDLETLIKTFKENQKNQYIEEELNMVYAKIRQTLNKITYKGEILDFQTLLNNTLKEHNIKLSDSLSFKSLYQLMSIVSISAFVTNDYFKIESFLIKTYNSITSQKIQSKQLFYHIEVLYMIANTLFRNKKFELSLHYLDQMHTQMLSNKKKHYNTFKLKYNLLLALNYNYSNQQDKAIQQLIPFTKVKHVDIESLLDIHLSLIMFYIQKNEFKKAHTVFSKFYHTNSYYTEKAGIEWVLKKNLAEIILHIELQNIDLVDSRILSFKRQHYPYLKQINQHRAITFLNLVEYYYKNPKKVTSKSFHNTVEASFKWIAAECEDIFVMSFYAWLKSKMENSDLYKTTMDLINQ
ncbi:hypothetical protein [Hanstruepera marina]|uniref:hypothetical protein n=1 Tax=Hanstruepera marina TaxID=2873265 RepID=UPI001CA73AEA|nr:hypothetical protein [Hanstruepera marina]